MNTIIDLIKNTEYRPNWDEYFITLSYLVSKRSSCDRLHVGCVITNNNRILSTGYNGHVKGGQHKSLIRDGHEQLTIHAETNAIADAASRGVQLQGASIYVTHYPCINCTKNLIAAGIKQVIYCEDYKNDEICDMLYREASIQCKKHL